MTFTWADVERITGGKIGRNVSAACPFCSHLRTRRNRHKKVFSVKLKDPDFAIFHCAHCGESGYVHNAIFHSISSADSTARKIESERKEREDKAIRTARALELWNER